MANVDPEVDPLDVEVDERPAGRSFTAGVREALGQPPCLDLGMLAHCTVDQANGFLREGYATHEQAEAYVWLWNNEWVRLTRAELRAYTVPMRYSKTHHLSCVKIVLHSE